MVKKIKSTKKPKTEKPVYYVKLIDQTSPKFAHNAIQAGKDVIWTYSYYPESNKSNAGEFEIEMDLNKFKKMKENVQSKNMNDAAIAWVQGEVGNDYDVKLTSR